MCRVRVCARSDDSEASEMSVEAIAAMKETEAMEKAAEGDFVADICIVCAFGLPKVCLPRSVHIISRSLL
jgi:hypothetical protein